jgi:hypothetical protein
MGSPGIHPERPHNCTDASRRRGLSEKLDANPPLRVYRATVTNAKVLERAPSTSPRAVGSTAGFRRLAK